MTPPLQTPRSPVAGPAGAALLVALGFPWFVHAAVVLSSALGARPLAHRDAALGLLSGAAALTFWLARLALRAQDSREPDSGLVPPPPLVGAARLAARALCAAGALAFALGVLCASTLPVVAYDALAYRLPVIAQWLDAGRIAWVVSDDPVRNGYPLGQEAVSAVLAAATGSLRFASTTSFVYVAAGALAIFASARAAGVRRELAAAASAVFVLVPMMLLNAASGYVDAAFAGASVALLCCTALLARAPRPDPLLLAATGMAAAHALALKGTGLGFVALCALALVVVRAWNARGQALRLASTVRWTSTALAWSAPGLFWAARNLVHTGNPLWPVEIRVAGHTLLRGVGSMDAILDTAHNTPPQLRALGPLGRVLHSWLQWSGPALDFDSRLAGLGYAWPLLALPAIGFVMAGRRRRGREGRSLLALVVVLSAACFALQPMSWWPRYTLWLWGAGALAIAIAAETLVGAGRHAWLSAWLAAGAVVCIAEGAVAVTHAKDAKVAVQRWLAAGAGTRAFYDARHAINATAWIAPEFWALGVERHPDVCRGAWKPATDNANLDGVFAQLTPRPRVHVLADGAGDWPRLRSDWQATGCPQLLLLAGSPVLTYAARDPGVSVERAVAFDPLFIVRPRTAVALGGFEVQP